MKYIIIPDVHGRTFWRNIVNDYLSEDVKFIFLGDYLDPYTYEENLPLDNGYTDLLHIIDLKKKNPDKFILLLGNHDIHYISTNGDCRGSRYDYENAKRNAEVFFNNIDLFQMTYTCKVNDKTFLFSHAGIIPDWVEYNCDVFNFPEFENDADDVNSYLSDLNNLPDFTGLLKSKDKCNIFFRSLGQISTYRGGGNLVGSMVWADSREHCAKNNRIPNIIQVFGHSQQEYEPINYDNEIYCLDVRRGFCLNENGDVCELNGDVIPAIDSKEEASRLKKEEDERFERIKKYAAFFF